jgi:hypothetical protein
VRKSLDASSVLHDATAKPLVLPGLSATSATSYWLGGTKEMAAINPILIIVNDRGADPFQRPANDWTRCGFAAIFCQESGELTAESNPSLTTW